MGKVAGITALLLDVAKGFVPTFFIPMALESYTGSPVDSIVPIACCISSICGHVWPVYLKFKGGKGIATSAGALIALAPAAVLIGLICWVIVFSITRYVSLASVIAAAIIPGVAWHLYLPTGQLLPWTLTAIGVLAIIRHTSNIGRLIKGNESKISFRKKND